MKPARATFLRKFGLTILYGILFAVFSAAVYGGVVKLFAIRQISVVGSNIRLSIDERRFPSTLLFFPSAKLRLQILADNPILADIRFEKKYPHTLMIIPTLRTPAALLITPTRRVFIDPRGIVLADAGSAGGLPQISADISGLHIGQKIADTGVLSGLSFISDAAPIVRIESMTIDSDGVLRAHTGNLDLLFTQVADTSQITRTLQTLITGFRIKGTLPKVIDLRFDKPVVTF